MTLTVSCVQKRSEVFNIVALRDPTSEGGRAEGVNLYGHQLCIRGCAKLLGASAKKLFKYRKLAGAGQSCPLDGRMRRAGPGSKPFKRPEARDAVFEFLTELYVKCAEPMPDLQFRDGQGERCQTSAGPRRRPRKGERPRIRQKRDPPLTDKHELRLLPPGTYTDYHRMFQAKWPHTKATLKLFCKAACSGLASCKVHLYCSLARALREAFHGTL